MTASFRVGVSAAKHLALTCINNNLSPAPGCWPVLAHVDFKAEFVWLCASAVASYLFLAILPPSSRQLAWCWLVLEAAFWVFQRTRYGRLLLPVHLYPHTSLYRTLRGSTTPPPVYDHLAVQELKRRFLQLGTNNIFNINQFLNAWFCGASIETIRHGNVAELVAYGFFSLRPAHLTPGQAAEVDAFVLDVQHTFNCTFAPGYNPSLRFLSHLWQPLRVWHKPLALYAAIEGYAALSSLMLQCRGFVRHRHGGFDVYIHLQGCDASSVPIVLLHGVGFGLLPYLPLLSDIQAACPGAPLIVVEAHHVSQRLCITDGARSVDDVASCVLEVLQELGVSQACMVGHSYGSFVVSRLLHMRPEIVHSCVVADPVAMMICYPRLLQAFVYAVRVGVCIVYTGCVSFIQEIFILCLSIFPNARENGVAVSCF